jgi:cation diffusion facilitator family transporter
MQEGSRKAIIAAFFANLGIAVSKFVGFLLTGSAGLLAEAGHSLADTGNQALLMLGGKKSQRRATERHQFGFGNERYFWAFVVALVLFSMGGLFALYEGIQKLIHPHEAESLGIAIGILIAAVGLETFSLMTAVREVNHVKPPDQSYWQFIRTAKQPELPIVLLEDIGAEIGLIFALVGLVVAHFTGNARWDAVGSVAIGLLLVIIAGILAVRMKALLIGESATSADQDQIVDALTSTDDVERVIHIRTLYFGPDELMVAAKLGFAANLTVADLARAVDAAEAAVRTKVPSVGLIYIEPDLYRDTADTNST